MMHTNRAFLCIYQLLLILCSVATMAQQAPALRIRWEELTAPDFARAVEESKTTCLLPLGILEKHGPHLPL